MTGRKKLTETETEYLKLELAAQSLAAFVLYTFPDYEMGWVHEEICLKLDKFLKDVREKKSPRLMLMMPPRHGKSELASRRFPAFALGVSPSLSIIAASYGLNFSGNFNREILRIMQDPSYARIFPKTRLPKGSAKRAGHLRVTGNLFELVGEKGSYRATSIGGPITGMGADIIIIDDPIKNGTEAGSERYRNRLYDWYSSVALSRLEPGGGVIIIMTRWHDDDLCGRLLETETAGGKKWDVARYPAIAEADEPKRKKGEALCPARYDIGYLLKTKEILQKRSWSALYQQRPEEEDGNIIRKEWFKHYSEPPKIFSTMLISFDMCFETVDPGFSTGQVWGLWRGSYYLLDQVRGRMDFPEMLRAFAALAGKYPRAYTKIADRKKNGESILRVLSSRIRGVKPVDDAGGSMARCSAMASFFQEGKVYLPDPKNAPWIRHYESSLLKFPTGSFADETDATSQAICYLAKNRP